jgi:PHD/YefM family antitoxin component YafN of YafNO toxin-antitoxin module
MVPKYTFDISTVSIEEVKKSPIKVFRLAAEKSAPVYVLSKGSVVGVMLTLEQYEAMNQHIEEMENRLIESDAKQLPAGTPTITYTFSKALGNSSASTPFLDADDSWE